MLINEAMAVQPELSDPLNASWRDIFGNGRAQTFSSMKSTSGHLEHAGLNMITLI